MQLIAVDPYVGVQVNRKELNKKFMMILNCKKPFGLHDLYKIIQHCKYESLVAQVRNNANHW